MFASSCKAGECELVACSESEVVPQADPLATQVPTSAGNRCLQRWSA